MKKKKIKNKKFNLNFKKFEKFPIRKMFNSKNEGISQTLQFGKLLKFRKFRILKTIPHFAHSKNLIRCGNEKNR